jgi:hypothetical protein
MNYTPPEIMSGRKILLSGLIFSGINTYGQEEETGIEHNWLYNGYIKDLLTVNVLDDSTLVDNLIHNRLNFQWWPKEYLNIYVEVRNRIFFGDLVSAYPNYSELIDTNDDFFDLSWTIVDSKDLVIHSMIDRLYVEYHKKDWEIRLGRQRINWGVNLVWNPNDLFNAFSYFDFDYEERPGSDAIRIKRYTGFASSIEVASNFSNSFDELVSAAMWKINKGGYDFQLLAGKSFQDIAIGLGWAGNIKGAGFKGEATLFEPYENTVYSTVILTTISLDYSFENSLYLHASGMYNSQGLTEPGIGALEPILSRNRLTVRNLSPYKWSTFLQLSYPVHPLVTTGVAAIFYPGDNALFLNPSIGISLPKNFDLDVLAQVFFNDTLFSDYKALAKLFFVRLKWSF